MLDVHPPEHGIHGVRDFAIHLMTITVGLLIALGLENAVEAMHHRHQRKEAEATLRQEIADNQGKLSRILESSKTTHDNMVRTLLFLQARRDGERGNPSGISFSFSETPLESTGWRTALATGAISYMSLRRYESSPAPTKSSSYSKKPKFVRWNISSDSTLLSRKSPTPRN